MVGEKDKKMVSEFLNFKYNATCIYLTKRTELIKNKKYFLKLNRFYAEIKPLFFKELDISVRYSVNKTPVIVLMPNAKVLLENRTVLAFLKERCYLNVIEE